MAARENIERRRALHLKNVAGSVKAALAALAQAETVMADAKRNQTNVDHETETLLEDLHNRARELDEHAPYERFEDPGSVKPALPLGERYAELKARVEALGCQLFKSPEDEAFGVYVGDPRIGEIVFIEDEFRLDSELPEWIESREKEAAANAGERAAPADDETGPDYTLLRDSQIDAIYAVRALANAIEQHTSSGTPLASGSDDDAMIVALTGAVGIIGAQLEAAFAAGAEWEFEKRVGSYLASKGSSL